MKENIIVFKKLEYLYLELTKSLLSSLALGLAIVVVLWGEVSHDRLLVWYGVLSLLSALRFATLFSFKYDKDALANQVFYLRLFWVGIVLSGIVWGSISVYIFPASHELQLLLVLLVSGLGAGAIGSVSPILKMYLIFILLSLSPFALIFLFSDIADSIFVSIIMLVFFFSLSNTANHFSKQIDKSIRLSLQNEDLIHNLEEKANIAIEANKAKSNFLSIMSHEIRTPLNAILGYINILKNEEDDNGKLEKLGIVEHSSHLLLGVINDILDYNKMGSGNLKLDPVPCEINRELEHLLKLFKPLCLEKELVLESEIDKALPKWINIDNLRLSQILTNMFSNAIKFTPKGKKVYFGCHYNKDDNKILFEVVDEGIGIDKSQHENIFKSFKQADESTTRKYGGTGLGLAISYKLSLLFNSSLKVESELGKGSRFFFEVEVDECEVQDEVSVGELSVFSEQKILVAEDNITNQMLIRLLLEDMHLDVDMANDGEQAVAMYNPEYEVVLMDINMPKLNGVDALKQIRKQYPESIIIALTANALTEDKDRYMEEGFNAYVAKPIDVSALHQKLSEYLS